MSLFALVDSIAALVPRTPEETVKKTFRSPQEWVNTAAIAGTTALGEFTAGRVKQKCRLVGAAFIPSAAVTANATNFFTLLIDKRTAAVPGTPVNVITFAADTPTTDDIAAWTAKEFIGNATYAPGAAADYEFAEGDTFTVEVTKTGGSGLAFPAGTLQLIFEGRD